MRNLPVSESRSTDLETLCNIGAGRLTAIQNALSSSRQRFLRLEQLSAFLVEHLEPKDAIMLAALAVSLRRVADRNRINVKDVLDSLTGGLKERGWLDQKMSKWNEVKEPLNKIVSDRNVEMVTKTSDLYYRHAYHIHDIKVITDIRPVLNEERGAVDASIVTNTLFLRYSDRNEREKSIEIAIAYSELKRMRDEFDQALKKTDLIKKLANDKFGVPAMIYDRDW